MFKKFLISSICSSTILLAQSGAGINVNEDDFEIEGTLDSRNLQALQTSSTIYLADFNFINVEDNKKTAKLMGAGVGATNKFEGAEGVELTFGAKAILANVDDNSDSKLDDNKWFAALPLMAMIRYTFPPLMFNIPPISIETKGLYAPKALSFGDSHQYSEFRVNVDIEMIENIKLYTGYRNIITGFAVGDKDNEDYIFSNGFYGGLKFTY
ncbi:hypothetical protein MNB_SV-12-442 [hydrothermal vent metagenome]|uniref:Outer membrane protein beta-barrel domain-containing protein n=1 Tax=hydrothermal vent metagenome TaxID=652676 RepID=A0A1W1BEL2_9ZZZZ